MTYKTCVSIAEKTPKKLKQTLAKALKKSDYAEVKELNEKFKIICSSLCSKIDSIKERLTNIEAIDES